ncbi:hypothetical protein HDV00_007331 [Rhizophlyctis rosea]|nr:hypothetical protein HDV00_007331 [Rhizophlyctis rosea]
MQEQQTKTIKLEDRSTALFKEILRFIYMGQAIIQDGVLSLVKFYMATDRFQLTECAEWTRAVLQGHLLGENQGPRTCCKVLRDILPFSDLKICQMLCWKLIEDKIDSEGDGCDEPLVGAREYKDLIETDGFEDLMEEMFGLGPQEVD